MAPPPLSLRQGVGTDVASRNRSSDISARRTAGARTRFLRWCFQTTTTVFASSAFSFPSFLFLLLGGEVFVEVKVFRASRHPTSEDGRASSASRLWHYHVRSSKSSSSSPIKGSRAVGQKEEESRRHHPKEEAIVAFVNNNKVIFTLWTTTKVSSYYY